MDYRLGLDIGTNSIGWAVLELNTELAPIGIIDSGVRIFSNGREPRGGESTAVKRRIARGIRRNRDRYKKRRRKLLELLVEFGLLPEDERERKRLVVQDPYELRAKGVRERIELYQLGRALFHLQQRRGFKSNRKTDRGASDNSMIHSGIEALRSLIKDFDSKTYGEFLYKERLQRGQHVRCRKIKLESVMKKGKGKPEEGYEFYPARELIAEEIDELWKRQVEYHPELTEDYKEKVKDVILFQRKLKPQIIGRCIFEPEEDRASKALPLVQQLRIYQELNNLRLIDLKSGEDKELSKMQRDTLAEMLCKSKGTAKGKYEVKFDKLRKAINAGENYRFNLESETRKGLEGDTTSALMAYKERFGAGWYDLSEDAQTEVIRVLNNDEGVILACLMEQQGIDKAQAQKIIHSIDNDELVIGWLQSRFGVSQESAEKIAFTNISDDYGSLGLTAARRVLAELKREVITFDKAVIAAKYKSHSELSGDKGCPSLPYYGQILSRYVVADKNLLHPKNATNEVRFGKIGNPTVHIVLNQLRKLVNEIIKEYGRPARINLEVLRELKNGKKKKLEYNLRLKKNTDANEKYRAELSELGIPANAENILRMRLLHEMKEGSRVCVYSGENISKEELFSENIEIDHILPFSKSLDDSIANKLLCLRRTNREKGNMTPYEAWGNAAGYEDILERASLLPANKRWRFNKDAMERFERNGDFITRQLTDTQYITRCTREYLDSLYTKKERRAQYVTCIPGRLTGLFRNRLGFNSILRELRENAGASEEELQEKVRHDHRNHVLDAILIGIMDRSFLQRAARHNAREVDRNLERFLAGFEEPWADFRESIKESINRIVVSHRPDHGLQGQLHNETAYGKSRRRDKRGNAVHRVSVATIEKAKDILALKGKRIRAKLVVYLTGDKPEDVFEFLEGVGMEAGRKGEQVYKLKRAVKQLEDYLPVSGKELKEEIVKFFAKNGIMNIRIIEMIGGLIPIRDREGCEYKYYKPDSNAYYDIYLNKNTGKWEGEIVPTYYANNTINMRTGLETKFETEDYSKIIRLFNNDMVELTRGERTGFFRVVKMSEGVIALVEHEVADNDRKLLTKSPDKLCKAGCRFIKVTSMGRVRYLSD